ncbi:MAG: DUF2214 family protein [Campylobacterota bacterium]
MEEILVRFLHFVGIIFLSSTLVFEHILLKDRVTNDNLKTILRIDLYYLISAFVTLVAGLVLWFVVGKDSGFYTQNPFFHIKVTLFFIMMILAVYNTLFLRKYKNTHEKIIDLPKKVIMIIRLETLLLLIIPLLGSLVAAGYGYKG